MQKIILLFSLIFILTSCGKVDAPATLGTGTQDVVASGTIQTDENAKDPEMFLSGTSSLPDSSTSIEKNINTPQNTAVSSSGKSEDEIVKDFEKEIDTLLNSIDTDGKKK